MSYKIVWTETAKENPPFHWHYLFEAEDVKGNFGGIPNVRAALPPIRREFLSIEQKTPGELDAFAVTYANEVMDTMPKPSPEAPEEDHVEHEKEMERCLFTAAKDIEGLQEVFGSDKKRLVEQAELFLKIQKACERIKEEGKEVKPVEPIVYGAKDGQLNK